MINTIRVARIRQILNGTAATDVLLVTDTDGVVKKKSLVALGIDPDHDWYEVGQTTTPDAIGDNMFTQGQVGIGILSPIAHLHVTSGGNGLTDYTAKFNSSPSGAGGIVFTICPSNFFYSCFSMLFFCCI